MSHSFTPSSDTCARFRILSEATALFAARGYQSTSVRDITAAAEANVAAVSYHFGSKADLYREVLRQAMHCPGRAVEKGAVLQNLSRADWLSHLIAGIFDSFEAHQGSDLQRILAHEEAEPSGVLGPVLGDLLRPRHDALVATLASEAGCPVDHPAIHRIVKTLIDAIKGYQMDKEGVLKHLAPAAFDVAEPRAAAIQSVTYSPA